MAVVTLFSPFEFTEAQDWDWDVVDQSPTSLTISDGVHTQVIEGNFKYSPDGDVSGTATGTSFYLNDELIYTITGMSRNAATLADFAATFGDTQQMYAYVLSGNDTLTGSSGDDALLGYAGNDIINGGEGDDFLSGGAGADTMTGGQGDDVYVVDDAGDKVIELANEGQDVVWVNLAKAGGTYTLSENVENATLVNTVAYNLTGNALDNTLIGNSAANILDGGAGDDYLAGGLGNDTYIIDAGDTIFEDEDEGVDLVKAAHSYQLGQNLENLTLLGSSNIDGKGNSLNNVITGNDGNNKLDGVGGVDTLIGGKGDDKYVVDLTENNALEDKVVELAGGGIDTLVLYSEYENNLVTTLKLDANLEHLDARDTGSLLLNLTGNASNNILMGNNGANTLDGGAGADTLIGGLGDDTYIVDNVGDTVQEELNGGIDTVKVAIATAGGTYTLGNNLENAALINTVAFNLNGNELNNILTGNAAANRLDGGVGADTMNGGAGNDTYVVDNVGDVIIDTAGIDTVETHLSYSLVNRLDLENIKLTGNEASFAIGNDKANTLTGNLGGNTLDGGAGADTLSGGAGDDFYVVDLTATNALEDTIIERADEGNDVVFLRGGSSTAKATTLTLGANLEILDASQTGSAKLNLTGNALNNVLVGNNWDNTLNGGAGADFMRGGLGNDTYVVDNAGDSIEEQLNEGLDKVNVAIATAGGTYVLGANLEDATLTNTVAFNLTGNSQVNTLTGNAAANRIDGGGGADKMFGGAGNDTYVVDNLGDEITDTSGIDTVETHLDYSLLQRPTLENITLTGNQGVSATGNALANILDGSLNTAANVLTGGKGNDTYIVGAGDTAVETLAGDGVDLVKSYANYTLGANLENLTLMGTGSIFGIGNELNNIILGNSASNQLNGRAGVDTLKGGDGDDVYFVDLTSKNLLEDSVTENAAEGTDVLVLQGGNSQLASAVTLTLGANLEVLDASQTGSVKLNLTGNVLNNILVGNNWDNTLNGGAGADVLIGRLGNDTYVVDNVGDIIEEQSNEGWDKVNVAIATAGGTYVLGANLEDATLTNTVAFNLTGNELNNILTGNAAANLLEGGAGNDTLLGGAGNDTLLGGDGNDTLNGGAGIDVMSGGKGNDTYVIDSLLDSITEQEYEGIDLVNVAIATAGKTYVLGAHLENATLTNTVAFNLTGNAFDNILTGNAAANIIDGGAGADLMIGGAGNDTYYVDDENDVISDSSGIDTIISSVSYSMTVESGVENLRLSGSADLYAEGNSLANNIYGNSGNNFIDGFGGADTLYGGDGHDVYIVDLTDSNALEDKVVELANQGIDTVVLYGGIAGIKATTITLMNHVENLDASETEFGVNLNLVGNGLNNILVGNTGKNIFTGGLGSDTFVFYNLNQLSNTPETRDVITDFKSGTDHIDLSGLGFNFQLIDSNAAFTGAGQLKFTGGVLYGSVDGDATADFSIQLTGVTGLTMNDFIQAA